MIYGRGVFFGTKKNTHTVQPRGIGPFPICPEPLFENEADNESFGYFLSTDIFVAIVTLVETMAFHLGGLSSLWASTHDPENYFVLVKFFPTLELEGWFNPLRPNISMHILYTVLYTFPKVLTRRICLLIKRLLPWWPFPLFSWP